MPPACSYSMHRSILPLVSFQQHSIHKIYIQQTISEIHIGNLETRVSNGYGSKLRERSDKCNCHDHHNNGFLCRFFKHNDFIWNWKKKYAAANTIRVAIDKHTKQSICLLAIIYKGGMGGKFLSALCRAFN